jgi:hypothetical protein
MAVALAVLALLGGCAQETAIEEDAIYGQVMADYLKEFKVPVSYDDRVLPKELVSAVTDFYAAVQSRDLEAMKEVTAPNIEEYLAKYSQAGLADIMDVIYGRAEETAGGEFVYDLVEIKQMSQDRELTGMDYVLEQLEEVSQENGNGPLLNDITETYALTVDFIFKDSAGARSTLRDDLIFVFNVKGKYCIML